MLHLIMINENYWPNVPQRFPCQIAEIVTNESWPSVNTKVIENGDLPR